MTDFNNDPSDEERRRAAAAPPPRQPTPPPLAPIHRPAWLKWLIIAFAVLAGLFLVSRYLPGVGAVQSDADRAAAAAAPATD